MNHLNDRQRVELLLPIEMMIGLVRAGDVDHDADTVACIEHLTAGALELIGGLDDKAKAKILRRVKRTHVAVSLAYTKDGAEVAKYGLIVFFLIKHLVETGYLVIPEGGEVDRGISLYMAGLEHAAREDLVVKSATKQSAKLLGHLQRLGFYEGAKDV